MAGFKTIDAAAFDAAAERGRKAYAAPRATAARFDRRTRRVIVALDTGIDFAFDPSRAPELRDAAPDDLAGVTVEGVGSTIRFPPLDADFTVSRILEGFPGPMDWTRREMRAMASRDKDAWAGGRGRFRADQGEETDILSPQLPSIVYPEGTTMTAYVDTDTQIPVPLASPPRER